MPFPLLLIPAIAAAVVGGGEGIHGAIKMGNARKKMDDINALHEKNIECFRQQNVETCQILDTLGILELDVLKSFGEFSKVFEKIRDKPEFKSFHENGVSLPEFIPDDIKKVSIGAANLLNLLKGGVAGAAGGFAAAGAVPAAIMAFGTASTGTPIAALGGQAAINAMLASLGGGSIAAGGGGMALGAFVLNVTTFAVGLLIGGIIFSVAGSKISDKVEEAWDQVEIETASVEKICIYIKELSVSGKRYFDVISNVRDIYTSQLRQLRYTVNVLEKTNYKSFTNEETLIIQNTILLVQLLHEMCRVKLVLQNETEEDINTVNHTDIEENIVKAKKVIENLSTSSNNRTDSINTHSINLTSEADTILDSYE